MTSFIEVSYEFVPFNHFPTSDSFGSLSGISRSVNWSLSKLFIGRFCIILFQIRRLMSPLMSFSAQYLYEEFPHCPLLCTFCFVYLLFRSQIDHGIDLAFFFWWKPLQLIELSKCGYSRPSGTYKLVLYFSYHNYHWFHKTHLSSSFSTSKTGFFK
jgi:hypothetical protein